MARIMPVVHACQLIILLYTNLNLLKQVTYIEKHKLVPYVVNATIISCVNIIYVGRHFCMVIYLCFHQHIKINMSNKNEYQYLCA